MTALLAPRSGHAQTRELAYDLRLDTSLLLGSAAWIIGSELAKPQLAAAECHWCDRSPNGSDTLNALDANVRAALRWDDTGLANALSHVVGYGLTPLVAFGALALAQWHDDALDRYPVDMLIVLEAAALSLGTSQIVKFAVGRQRPFVHASERRAIAPSSRSSDGNTSFYSGHTAFVFSVAVAAGTVAILRGYRWAAWVWIPTLALAMTTAYLRIASDRHYVSDVVVGSAAGAGVALATVLGLHRPRRSLEPLPVVSGVPGGAIVGLIWRAP